MASVDTVSVIRELRVRESRESGPLALLGAADHEPPYPSCCPKARHYKTNRLAHFSAHLFDAASVYGRAELKIMQELLCHSTIRVTLDTYTQAVTTEKRNAQEAVVALLFREKPQET
jgi:hypothetical protein